MGKVLEQTACVNPDCGSSDAYTVYEDDNGKINAYCYSCGKYFKEPYKSQINEGETVDNTSVDNNFPYTGNHTYRLSTRSTTAPSSNTIGETVSDIDEALAHPVRALTDRCISHAACERYGVRVGVDTRDGVSPTYHLYPCYRNGNLTGFKQRIVSTKQFLCIGDCKNLDLFGANVIPTKGKTIYITEGELDALALYDTLKKYSTLPGWEPSVVSLPLGASSAVKSISLNLEILDGYEKIVLCFDSDTPGTEAATQVCKILAGKVYVTKLAEKDANEMVLKGKGLDLKWAVLSHARKYQPDGILNGKDCWKRYKSSRDSVYYPYPTTMSGLNEKVYGSRPGSLITITAGSGSGKTQFLRELKYHYLRTTEEKIADISLEEDIGDTIGGMLSLHLNKRITLPDVTVSEDAEKVAFEEIYGSGRVALYDHFGGMDDSSLFSKLRFFAAEGNKFIFLDHLSIVISEYASEGGERERIDTVMTKLAKFCKETNTVIFLVVHLKKSDKRPFEEGVTPTLDDLRGSASIKQLSFDIFALSRNQQHNDPRCKNTIELHVLKSRFTGRTGKAGYLLFDDSSGRMIQTEAPPNYYSGRRE